ncbi:hypothetical protein JQX13_43610 [Archangium violaceum]|uniref:hypothetical protein n=1 Tax=Archangium violaceum TaxID=83451 RepID=UPI00193C5EF9|nr:hypothetical protein [Archangium violaceum]QRK06880.1 hypothetical protein JQX13_43610 [Archangium violaceum]
MSRHSFKAAFLCGVLSLSLGGATNVFASDTRAEQSQTGLRVTFLMYSGRPNPSVTVTDPEQVRAIEERLARAFSAGPRVATRASHAVLGYTGIKVERLGAATRDAKPFIVKRDVLRVEDEAEQAGLSSAAGPTGFVSREAMDLEDFLLALGRDQGVLDEVGLSVIRSSN